MEYDKGYIRLNRRFFSEIMWTEARTFSSCEAWLDLIQSSRFDATPRKVSIGGREVVVCRGQFAASIRFLAKRWQWGERKVRSFLAYLKKREMITSESSQGINLITILNYDRYDGNAGWDTTKDTAKDTAKDTTIAQSVSNLQEPKTQQRTQVRTQSETQPSEITEKGQNLGHRGDTKKEYYNISNEIYRENKKEDNSDELSEKAADATSSPSRPETDFFDSSEDSNPQSGLKTLSQKERKSCAKKKEIDFDAIMADFNARFAGVLPKVQVMSSQRKSAVRARIAEFGEDSVAKVFDNVAASKFLQGDNDRGWKADFEWIFKPTKYVKILEGSYTNYYGRKEQRQFGNTRPGDFAGKGYTDI